MFLAQTGLFVKKAITGNFIRYSIQVTCYFHLATVSENGTTVK